MKITIYTTSACQFSKQEREYLKLHDLPYEEKNLETNREYLTEMLAVSNNFAGTPVTKIEKDDGAIAVLKGFTQAEFDKTLNVAKPEPTVQPMPIKQAAQDTPMPPQPTPPMPEPTPPPPPTPTPQPPTEPPQPTTPQAPPQVKPAEDPQLNALLKDLQQKANANQAPVSAPSNGPSDLPQIPNPNF